MTQQAGQAFDEMASTSNEELNLYDGVVTVVRNNLLCICLFLHLLCLVLLLLMCYPVVLTKFYFELMYQKCQRFNFSKVLFAC